MTDAASHRAVLLSRLLAVDAALRLTVIAASVRCLQLGRAYLAGTGAVTADQLQRAGLARDLLWFTQMTTFLLVVCVALASWRRARRPSRPADYRTSSDSPTQRSTALLAAACSVFLATSAGATVAHLLRLPFPPPYPSLATYFDGDLRTEILLQALWAATELIAIATLTRREGPSPARHDAGAGVWLPVSRAEHGMP